MQSLHKSEGRVTVLRIGRILTHVQAASQRANSPGIGRNLDVPYRILSGPPLLDSVLEESGECMEVVAYRDVAHLVLPRSLLRRSDLRHNFCTTFEGLRSFNNWS